MTTAASLFQVEGGPPIPAGGEASFVRARSGNRLRAAVWTPPGRVRGSVVLSPGRTEMIEKYGEVTGELLARGFAVLCHDWLGQGLSDRLHRDALRGHVRGGAGRFLAGLADVLSAHEARLPRPWIGMGHSMGGGLTALAAVRTPELFDALLLSAPMAGVLTGSQPPARVRSAARAMGWLGLGAALPLPVSDPLRDRFDTNVLTHDRARFERTAALIRTHQELRLAGPTWSWLGFAFELSDALARPGAAERVTIPVRVLAAAEEKLVDNAAARRFAERLPHGRYLEVAGAYHELLMETDAVRARVWKEFDALISDLPPLAGEVAGAAGP